jgi:hypothetical protein
VEVIPKRKLKKRLGRKLCWKMKRKNNRSLRHKDWNKKKNKRSNFLIYIE